MIRYQIRNEYGLADPEVLAAPGEEDDPEALLEGVAMAGLVGVLRQLGDLAEFAAEIFHDLHEDVMATASRGHGLMLRLQQLEAEFPAVEKAIISQTDHSNYPHDDGVEWHANLQLKQNMITQGDMPRFILDSYEECRGPPHLFTLDKFDVAGAGASLKRYSDPSFFKTEHASNMIETDVLIEKKPRRTKKKAMRWRKGATLKSLLIANSEPHTTPKDRTSRKVPPRTTKLKSRHPVSPDHKTISRICREHLQEVISSQQKILSRYSARHYHVNFRSTDSSETASPFGEMDKFGALVQSSGKLELTKVVPVNESDTMETKSAPPDGSASAYLEFGDKRILGKQHEPSEKNGIFHGSENLHDCPNLQVGESKHRSQSACEEKPLVAGVPADQKDFDGCRPDDIVSDQDNLIDARNVMDSEGEAVLEMESECDPCANVKLVELNCHSMEDENKLYVESPEVGPTKGSLGLDNSSNGGEPTCTDLKFSSDSALPTVSATNGPNSGSQTGRQLNGVEDEETFNDVDLMDVSSSSSVVSDNADVRTNDDPVSCLQYQDKVYNSLSDGHDAVTHDSDKQSLKTSSDVDGMAIGSNAYTEKEHHEVEHGQDIELDDTSIKLSKPNDVLEDEDKSNFGAANSFFHPTKPNQEEIHELEKELEAGRSLESDTSPSKLASLPDKDHVMWANDIEMDNVIIPEEMVPDTALTGLDPDGIHEHREGIALKHSSIHNNILYESYDEGIAEDTQPVPDGGLSTPFNKHVGEDHQILVLEEAICPTSLNTCKDDSMQAPVMAGLSTPFNKHVSEDHQIVVLEEETSPTINSCKDNSLPASALASDFNDVQKLPEAIPGLLPSQEEIEIHVGETLAPTSCMFSDGAEALEIGVPLAPSTSSLPNTSNSCVEQREFTEMKDIEGGNFMFAGESTTSQFADDVVPPEEFISASIYTEEEVLATESTEETSHDVQVQVQSSSPREELETVEAIHRNLGAVDGSSEHVSEKSILRTYNNPPRTEIETADEKCSDRDGAGLMIPVDSDYQEELLEEASHYAEVLSLCDLNKDGAVSLKSNTVEKQPANADQDLAWGMPAQGPCSTNPFMDPAYMMSHTQIYTSPSMNDQQCFPEEQDFLSELLIQHDNVGAADDSFWEPATPPDEVPLPSEVMTEEDFRSFCHEYHEIDFSAGTEASHTEPASDTYNIPNAFLVSESDFPCSNSALPVKLNQEACVHSKYCSQCAECSSAMDLKTSSGKDLKVETPGVDSHLKSHEFFSDNRSPKSDMLSCPVDLQQEKHGLSGVDSHSSSPLLDKDQASEEYLSNVVEVKQELEICADLVPHSFINEKGDGLDLAVPVEPEVRACTSDEYENQEVPCSTSTSEKNESLTLGKSVIVQGSEGCAFGEFDYPVIPSFSVDEIKDNLEAPTSGTSIQVQHESECCTLGKHDSQIVPSPLLDENIDELDGPPLSNCDILDRESEVCVQRGFDTKIGPCSTDENTHELDLPPLSSSVLVDLEPEDHASDERGSQVTPCSLVKDEIDESEDAQQNHVLEELEHEVHAPPELDFQAVPYSLNGGKVGEIEGPPSCNDRVESEKEPDSSTEVDSQTAAGSSNSTLLTDATVSTSTPAMPITEETYQLYPVLSPSVQPQSDSYEDPQALPPLPPLQWRLGRPRLGLLSRKDCMPETARRKDPVFQASSQAVDSGLGLLDQTYRSIEPVPSQAVKEDTCQSSLVYFNDENVGFGRFSTGITVTDVSRTEHYLPSAEASEHIKQERCISSSETGVEEHLEAGVTSATADEEHLDDSELTHGTDLYPSVPWFSLPAYEQQDPQLRIISSYTRENIECPSQMDPTASEEDKLTDVAGSMENASRKEHDSEDRCHQQPQYGESSSEITDHEEHITNASEEGAKYLSGTGESPSDVARHFASGTPLKEGNSLESQILQEQNVGSSEDDQLGDPLPCLEPMAPQDYPHDECNLERENRHQASYLGLQVEWPGDQSKFVSILDEGSYNAEQPPVMGWTVGPQMLHPKYAISIRENQFEPNIADNHLIRKPISIKNIPRNPLVDAVAAHDRSSMRKVSELSPSTDKSKPNERNLLLEQIRNKTFNLKPVAPAKPTAMRSPARANTRNLKVAAIIEKANAIRQAVGSDDEDADSWSDA